MSEPVDIEALAPDTASLTAARSLARADKWPERGAAGPALWGLCQGSGAKPYKTLAQPETGRFKCTCPSRKHPCKHALGLLLLAAREPLPPAAAPLWAAEWLEEAEKPRSPKVRAPRSLTPDPEADARRRANVSAGLQELSLWLEDLLRRGLAQLPAEPYAFYDRMAARLVDAQAPGLARWIRELAALPAQGGHWTEQVLERLGLIQLLMRAYARLEQLSPELQAEVRSQLGWTIPQEALLAEAGQPDRWLILGQVFGYDDQLRYRRTWLLGHDSRRYALLLDFAFGSQPFKQTWQPGVTLDAELVWFPASWPLRALVKPDYRLSAASTRPEGIDSWQALRRLRAEALAANPWTELLPACIGELTPQLQLDGLWLQDRHGDSLPIWQGFEQSWLLLALSGGHPLSLSLEFDGERAYPLGVWSDEGYLPLAATA